MSALVLCPTCSRHASESELDCPFCASPLGGALPGIVREVSRRELTRGAIMFGAASLLGACASSEPAEERRTEDTTSGGDTVGDTDPDPYEGRRHRECDPGDMSCMAMPYGAPPMPESMV